MSESAVIDKNKVLLPAQDYNFLREKGIEYIQSLSGAIWTDHNLHDPGITVLEILCYALTDLGYRTGFDIADLLVSPDGAADPPEISSFFPAHEVLTASPLTIHDYRRLLLKIEGVRNAWFDPMMDPSQEGNYKVSEALIYADCQAGVLSYDPRSTLGNENPQVRLSGLYRVLLELDIDDKLGSLNEAKLTFTVIKAVSLKGVTLSLDSKDPDFLSGKIDFSTDFPGVIQVLSVTGSGKMFDAAVKLPLDNGDQIIFSKLVVRVVQDKPDPDAPPVVVTPADLVDLLADSHEDGPLALFWAKQQAIEKSLAAVGCVLDAHRNLCEDVLSIETVKAECVAVCADIEVKKDADLEAVQARVYHEIEQYFNPPVNYYTLKELLDEGLCADEIFNGPYVNFAFTCGGEPVFSKPGFIKTEELEASELRRTIYTSDIINLLMDLEEVVSIKNVLLRKYDADGNPIGPSQKWCLDITPLHQPVLGIEKSKILFFKNGIPYIAKQREFQNTLKHLRAMARKTAYVEPNQVLDLPRGAYRETDQFFSIQNDFPLTYGIGEAGLPATASNERVAQARQFKAYLTFFDQVLADYLAQLGSVRKLFSLDNTLAQTYFSRYLDRIPGVRGLFEDEFYVDKTVLQDDARRTLLTEDEALFIDRRNRLLDHLIARFAEQFTDYVMMMFSLDGDLIKTGKNLIDDKIDFLREYPVISRERHKAFNYRPQDPADLWDTENVSGLEKRVSRLLGIDDYFRRDLACNALFEKLFDTRKIGNEFRVEIKSATNTIIFKSKELFASRAAALDEARKIFPQMRQEQTYAIDSSGGVGQVFYTLQGGGASLRHDEVFNDEAGAMQGILDIIDRYDDILYTDASCNREGFYLIEHLLLRPLSDQDKLMGVCLSSDCEFCGEEDPYSFRISVILPAWPERFNNLHFRSLFERTLREECPAHIHARICWINNEQMMALDQKYRAWIDARSQKDVDQSHLRFTQRQLIQLLQRLRTVYPSATLHDCEEGSDENPVRLDNTNLGLF